MDHPDELKPRYPVALDELSLRVIERIMNAVTDYAVFVLDPQGRIATWNAGAQRIKGYTRSDVVGSPFSRFYRSEEVERRIPDRELEAAAAAGRFEDEGWRVRKDGSLFWANVVITALRNPDGSLGGFLNITRDFTARREQEEALRESEARFRLLLEGVADYAIYMLDPDGRIVSWNAGAERIKGFSADEVLGRHFSMFYPPDDAAANTPERILAEARITGRAEDEGWRVRRDGGRFWASAVVTRLLDAEGRLRGFAKVTRDVTDRQRAEALEEAERKTGEFLAMLSHELRNPLAPIKNAVALMAARELTDPTLRWARDVVERQTRHLGRLVDDLLDISRLRQGKIQFERENVDLADAVRHGIETVRPLAEARRHQVTVTIPDQPVRVVGDRTRLAQVISNLMVNAAKYTPDGGDISVAVEPVENQAWIRVRDNGMGIPPHLLDRVFDLFAQGDGPNRAEGGLGIGLALSRRIAEMHGGTLQAYSEGRDRGSEFIVRLPRFGAAQVSSPPDAPTAGDQASGALPVASPRLGRVLVVDDNADSAESTAMLLRLWGLEVCTAHDGVEGLRLARGFRPHCVVLDLGLPGVDGYEVARRIRQMPVIGAGTLLIAVTGYGQVEDRERTRRAGFDHHLTKPMDPEALRTLLLGPDSPRG